jgi:CBS domain-containing protein
MDETPILVDSALEPVQYRVYPDTPLDEVIDLIVRRGVRAVPVVGEQYEVLGIITSGDALGQILRNAPAERAAPAEQGSAVLARDVMTRSVLCVSEDQSLNEAAHILVNRDVEQLPVVRDGELIGFVTRDSILRSLHEGTASHETNNEDDK